MDRSQGLLRRSLRALPALLILLVVTLAMADVAARAFWRLRYDVPFFRPDLVLYAFYPELRELRERVEEEGIDILLLGGSVLQPDWGSVGQELLETLTHATRRPVRIHNLARQAHTSRDSFLKYELLDGVSFDLVVFYQGINEARANNAPPSLFRSDYSHYSWYEAMNALARRHGHSVLSLPLSLEFIAIRLKDKLGLADYVPEHSPKEEWIEYGREVRSAGSFEENLHGILETARERSEPVLLMTFATFVPTYYSRSGKRVP